MEFMAKIQILEGPMSGAEFELKKEVIFVGRAPANEIQMNIPLKFTQSAILDKCFRYAAFMVFNLFLFC